MFLPRPDLIGAPVNRVDPSFPSGHVGTAAALPLGLGLVASPRIRPYVIVTGMLWFAVTTGAVLATCQHRPSDVLGATPAGLRLLQPRGPVTATGGRRTRHRTDRSCTADHCPGPGSGRRARRRHAGRLHHAHAGLRGDGLPMRGPVLVHRSGRARTHRTPHTPSPGQPHGARSTRQCRHSGC
ncbi:MULTISPECIES: phosphatase PAP2 family protein [Streptomyces]|uniref:phosphatase PAP2 family protein n=1 Tax=Streptomyces sp. MUM 16J TaxID=2791988 RepID=UPI001F041789|nr:MULTISPECIES: phosphatase PAP2 family protein [Streptomyces]